MPDRKSSSKTKTVTPDNKQIVIAVIGAAALVLAALISGLFLYLSNKNSEPPAPPQAIATATPTPLSLLPPTLVQHKLQGVSTNSNVVQFDRKVTSGDVLLVAITHYESTLLGVNDDENDTYIQLGHEVAYPPAQQFFVELYYVQNAIGGPTTVTISLSPPADPDGGGSEVGIYEYSGLSRTSPLEDAASNTGNNQPSTTLSERILTTTEKNEVCFAVGVDSGPEVGNPTDANTTVSEGDGWTLEDFQEDFAHQVRFYTEDGLFAPGGCRPTFSIGYPSYWAIIGAAFKP